MYNKNKKTSKERKSKSDNESLDSLLKETNEIPDSESPRNKRTYFNLITGKEVTAKIGMDWDYINELLQLQVPGTSIAKTLGISVDTLYRRVYEEFGKTFTEYAATFKEQGLNNIRKTMMDKALINKDTTMLIWLSKNWLGMSDKSESTVNVTSWSVSYDNDEEVDPETIDITESNSENNFQDEDKII
jgi:AraC-like DNA-binding protein